PIEDQLSLKQFRSAAQADSEAGSSRDTLGAQPIVSSGAPTAQVGEEFTLAVPTIEYGNPEIIAFTLPNPCPGRLLDLTWETFGYGVERLASQIKNVGRRLDVDICFGVNEAGLVMATFLASGSFARCKIGY